MGIEDIWSNIIECEGEKFHQIRGQVFSYSINGTSLMPSITNQSLSKKSFEQALELVPLENTTPVQHLRGPSYIYAILMDDRIRQKYW